MFRSIRLIFVVLFILVSCLSFSQSFLLNEDFSTATAITPPINWQNTTIAGQEAAKWRIDNPGNQLINFPITSPFAILDAAYVSPDTATEIVVLETPAFDASQGLFFLLFFDHFFFPDSAATASIQAFDGTDWIEVYSLDTATLNNPGSEVVDLTDAIEGVTNAQLRFVWTGHGKGFWAIDNVSIYSALYTDAGISGVDNPVMPFNAGIQDVKVTLKNFGYDTLSSAIIRWSVNGVMQPDYSWSGNILYGLSDSSINVGSYNFQSGTINHLKVWTEMPNGLQDPNSHNDTIIEYLNPAFCGVYTIGGSNPDFNSFNDAVNLMNMAGVSCPVTFNVRSGTYVERIIFDSIPGASIINTITFESESGDSSKVEITSQGSSNPDFLVQFKNAHYITLKKLKFSISGSNLFKLQNGTNDIIIHNCMLYMNSWRYNMFNISDTSNNILIDNNYITGASVRGAMLSANNGSNNIHFENNLIDGYKVHESYIVSCSSVNNIQIKSNTIQNSPSGFNHAFGINIDSCPFTTISDNAFVNNGFTFPAIGVSNSTDVSVISNSVDNSQGISLTGNVNNLCIGNRVLNANDVNGLFVQSGTSSVINNFIHITGESAYAGIALEQLSSSSVVYFNSVNVRNTNTSSAALSISGSSDFDLKNNIFSNIGPGVAVNATLSNYNTNWNYNSYFTNTGAFGSVNNILLDSLSDWQALSGSDALSIAVNPYFNPDSSPEIHQSFLNNIAYPITGIPYDIDSTLRNPTFPDIGAKEYIPCDNDAGIESFSSPVMPVSASVAPVKVILHNHGANPLTSVRINCIINDSLFADTLWVGNLSHNQTEEVFLGDFDFSLAPLGRFKAWTENPNNLTDCSLENDSTLLLTLAAPLCGNYTIGGIEPDFNNFTDALTNLNMAGISCPVTFNIRAGQYNEQLSFDSIHGTSAINTITFQSEDGDSTSAELLYNNTSSLNFLVDFNNAHYITFKSLKLNISGKNLFVFSAKSSYISVQNCNLYFNSFNNSLFNISDTSNNILIDNNYITGASVRGAMLSANNGSNNIHFENNLIDGYKVHESYIVSCSSVNNIQIKSNTIQNSPSGFNHAFGINIDSCPFTTISDNAFVNNGFTFPAIGVSNSSGVSITANTINNSKGIYLNSGTNNKIQENIIIKLQDAYGINTNSTNLTIANNYINLESNNNLACIYVDSQSQSNKILYNSLVSENTLCTSLYLANSENHVARNNIFYNYGGGNPVTITSSANSSIFDYNNYYSDLGIIGEYNGAQYMSLSSWATAISGEGNGFNLNPYFINPSSYKIYQTGLNGAGIPISGVTNDIENELRDPLAPDIGCDEFEFQSHLFGIVFHDVNQNGIQDENEPGMPGQIITIEPGNVVAMTDSLGMWTDNYIPAGTYTASIYEPDNWAVSTATSHVFFFNDTTQTTRVSSFGLYSTSPCPAPEITINAPELVQCLSGQLIYVTAKNNIMGTAAILDAYVVVELDTLITMDTASIPYTSLGDNRYRFDVGDLNPGQEVDFTLSTTLSCETFSGQTLCVQANVYQVDSCAIDTSYNQNPGVTPCSLPWDKSSLEVDGWCANDSVHFAITNTGDPGNGNMVCYSPVRVYLDGVLYDFDSIQLAGGQTVYYHYQGYGQTWRLEADQHPLHPGNSHPNANVEACGDTTNWTPGLINLFPQDVADP